MGDVKIRYYTTRQRPGRPKWGYWAPCLKRRNSRTGKIEPTLMARLGFRLVDCGEHGPRAWAIAESWNRKWDETLAAHQRGEQPAGATRLGKVYPPGSLGEAFARFRKTATWAKKKPATREDWLRGWKYIEPVFGDVDPRSVAMEDVDLWYGGDPLDPAIKGLLQTTGVREAHRAMKIWRALWRVAGSLNRLDGCRYCDAAGDPSLAIRRETPRARSAIWVEGEAVRLVKRAWRMGYHGLAAALAVAWDTSLSPVDVRSITPATLFPDAQGPLITLDRTKTGRPAIGTLSRRSERLLEAYIASLPFTLLPSAPIFHTRGYKPTARGGKPRAPVPYTKDQLGDDFRAVRAAEFPGDTRQIADFRRSGAIEATAGQVDLAALASKMANSIDSSKTLQATYLPTNASLVRLADEARARGREVMRGAARKTSESGK